MAQWIRVGQLPQTIQSRVMTIYTNYSFPIEVRHYCANWIESQQWNGFNEAHVNSASLLLTTLVGFLDNDSVGLNVRQRYKDIAGYLQAKYANQPLDFVRLVNACLEAERQIVNEAENTPAQVQSAESQREIEIRIDDLISRTSENGRDLQDIEAKDQEYANIHNEKRRIEEAISRLEQPSEQALSIQNEQLLTRLRQEKLIRDNRLLTASQDILQRRMMLALRLKSIHTTLECLVMQVIDVELAEWKQKQRCEKLADVIVRIRIQIDSLDNLIGHLPINLPDNVADLQPENKKNINSVLSKLATGAFIVERQPYQVLKKGSKFDVTVRWLVHSKLAVLFGTPKIKQTLISEEEARRIHEDIDDDDDDEHKEKETILTKELRMECPSLTFKDVKVKTIPRASRTHTDVTTVAEQKYGILFSFILKAGEDLDLTVRTMTLPVVMTTHGIYEKSSTATYLWDNHFSRPGRLPFQVPNDVSWPEFSKMLTSVFQGMTGTGLSESNLQYLGQKIFGTSGTEDFSSYIVTWNQFVKDDIPGFNFKFWDWFWSIVKLVREHLKGPWNEGLIEGFADKLKINECLLLQPIGTFMLRFSDGSLGGLTIAWVGEDPENPGEKGVFNLAPYNSKDLISRGLADRIKDINSLVALYPDIPKNDAFEKYYFQGKDTSEEESRGYIPHSLVNVIPGLSTQFAVTSGSNLAQLPEPMFNSGTQDYLELPDLSDLLEDIGLQDSSFSVDDLDQLLLMDIKDFEQ